MSEGKDIILVADYHCENIEFRWFNQANGQERTGRHPTTRAGILRQVEQAAGELEPGGQIVWIMESTTGWARVKELPGGRVKFVLANVLQMQRQGHDQAWPGSATGYRRVNQSSNNIERIWHGEHLLPIRT